MLKKCVTLYMYDVYLFDILFTWFLLTQILMIYKLLTKGRKIFLEKMRNHIEIKIFYHGSFWNLGEKSRNLWYFLFHVKGSFQRVLESPRRVEKLVEHSRIDGFVLYLAYDIIVLS